MDRDQGGASANNSSDFVRKLYKMLEESQYDSVVRWGDEGDSFVVLEIDEFTKNVLPRHFKHSNFASFVRQLNKYDFHKVRQNNEDNGQSAYGLGAWEFKHPEFQKNGKHSLDNIRRKAPAPRKSNQTVDDQFPAQQMDLLNTQLGATQHQFQILQEKYTDLAQGHIVLLQQTVHLQKIVKNHDVAMHRVMSVLHILESQNRRLSRSGSFNTNGNAIEGLPSQDNGNEDHIDTPLRQAADVLGEYSVDNLVNKELEQMSAEYTLYRNLDYSTPPHDINPGVSVTMADQGHHVGFGDLNDLDMVYPIGQTKGIDPINKDHINNIPYSLPTGATQIGSAGNEMVNLTNHINETVTRSTDLKIPDWGGRRPRIMLVEDDPTCSRIGSKFLASFNCNTAVAQDGLEAVNKLNTAAKNEPIDLILMDIIMPKLDGVSATAVIREFNTQVPIVAMTSNIRIDDIEVYFRYGMNDVLPKPFTKEGMLRCLEKHLAPTSDQHPGYVTTPGTSNQAMNVNNMNNISHISAPQSTKGESPTVRSPATATSWHSPTSNSITCPSPTSAAAPDGYNNMHQLRQGANGYVMGNAMSGLRNMEAPAPQNMAAPRQIKHRRVMSDMTNGSEENLEAKRQRMYPPQQLGPNNTSNVNNFT